MATSRLTAPNGTAVSVDSAKVDELTRRGFTAEGGSSSKTATKKAAAKKSSK